MVTPDRQKLSKLRNMTTVPNRKLIHWAFLEKNNFSKPCNYASLVFHVLPRKFDYFRRGVFVCYIPPKNCRRLNTESYSCDIVLVHRDPGTSLPAMWPAQSRCGANFHAPVAIISAVISAAAFFTSRANFSPFVTFGIILNSHTSTSARITEKDSYVIIHLTLSKG